MVETVHQAGGRIIAWTVNSRRAARALIQLGVDGLCTDDLRLMDTGDQPGGVPGGGGGGVDALS
jgi:glycerophosphoryl diester phosphodiesterase